MNSNALDSLSEIGNRKKHILLVDDEVAILEIMQETLEDNDFKVTAVSDPTTLPDLIEHLDIDTVVTDIQMPKMDGITFLKLVKRYDKKLPVIMITGHADLNNLMVSFRLGAYDYLKKPFSMNELLITVTKAIEKRALQLQIERYYDLLEEKVIEKTKELVVANQKLEENLVGTILAMINALEASDEYTRGHSERVTAISLMIGQQMDLDSDTLKILRLGSVLHDIGKLGISHGILRAPRKLDPLEYEVMKEHPSIGVKIIRPIDLDEEVFNIVGQHHERIDGNGYPNGLQGDQISMLARIVAVADTFDAITSDRPYRKALSTETAFQEILKNIEVQFDRKVVEAFQKIYRDINPGELSGLEVIKKAEKHS